MEFATRAIHGAVTVPIYSTSTCNTGFTRIIDWDRE
ncbi:hypothetical protein MAN88_48540 [Microcystis aeruginosa]|nr:hypothetical protein MAN88_48540 [Microcystis aeruginosa]